IPVAGVNVGQLEAFNDIQESAQGGQGGVGYLELFDLFAGGALSRFSIMSLGIMPYISASIILNLLQIAVPSLEKLAKEGGAYGKRKIQQYTRYLTIGLCILQSISFLVIFNTYYIQPAAEGITDADGVIHTFQIVQNFDIWFWAIFILSTTAGTMFVLWMGEQISDRGIGNGVSLVIFANIIARIPGAVTELAVNPEQDPITLMIVVVIFFIIIGLVTAENQATRNIPVKYGKHMVAGRMYKVSANHIPFKLTPAGVIPIIFASAIVMFPQQIVGMFGAGVSWLENIANALRPGNLAYNILYFLLVMALSYFYTQMYFNPAELADNIKRQGGFIPGIRAGQNTANYLSKVLNRITLPGSIFLGLVAIAPNIIGKIFGLPASFSLLMGGTSLLIMVGVALDTVKQIESHLLMRHYSGFLKKGKIKGRR
ncbi:MAG: preprotein translocase subunit SecY, partial [Spirochaetota bacterium]